MKKVNAFEEIRSELKCYDLQSVADAAEVNVNTLYNWINRQNKANFTTLTKVANAIGYKIQVIAKRK